MRRHRRRSRKCLDCEAPIRECVCETTTCCGVKLVYPGGKPWCSVCFGSGIPTSDPSTGLRAT